MGGLVDEKSASSVLEELSVTPGVCLYSVNVLVPFSRSQHSKDLQLTWQTLSSCVYAGNDMKRRS